MQAPVHALYETEARVREGYHALAFICWTVLSLGFNDTLYSGVLSNKSKGWCLIASCCDGRACKLS